ncbi:MAG: alanine--tRNA ligase [Rhodospirillales bacterium]|jgi:alanyl-tRNA synthetase|nr:alanine--tRNA ligase [Rhodospirillales bacterium]MBT4039450.1 alanine--tRNA ligase [Rhodospirillales bacterium]MBT4626592.1 alanine--tRNA ligase [Rhodospirillales bacterium]MBT5352416.1 alanine--tRNA ligase [Rhodospirillales bacterium]MBT5520430.1 alanine--tRNA ligase [Rhodospirillales bacterium]
MQTVNDIRKAFLDYFGTHGHEVVDSSPLVPRNDPTLMFTNAGMVQFKNVFTGLEQRDYSRAVTSQKCVRAGGKHNDLENVGRTARHHTFFEMLGNFSFGDYFKEHAIELAWNLITKEFGLSEDKLLVTVYAEDDDAFDLWKKIAGLSENKIIRIPTSDNFWAMGDTGPCGPCSEIFYDHGDHIPGGPPGSADEDGDRFIEIWNLVFMQYEQVTTSERVDLPHPSIDTGMGLERIAAVMQGSHDNYDIDLMRSLINASADVSGTDADGEFKISHRVIADHLRACSFLIADGVLPSNEGRGYVLRRIMRRGMRHAQLMGCKDPLMWQLVPALTAQMGQAFPELVRAEPLITETLQLEETRFKKTLDRGLKLLDEATGGMGDGGQLDGETAFKLYDTFGFPLDLTQDALKARSIDVDVDGFETAMERQRADARRAWSGSGEAATEAVWFEIQQEHGATEFLGYSTESAEGQIVDLVKDGARVSEAGKGDHVFVITSQTPFYGESGGQMGDSGVMHLGEGVHIEITNTHKKLGAVHVHEGHITGGGAQVGDDVTMDVDHTRRSALRANHSVTHLIHEALRRQLGDHVTQKGSLVAPDRMRFDIAHPKPITPEEITEVEASVNAQIRANTDVVTRLMEPDAAVEAGAMALFGEKYGDEVRVVSMGADGAGNYSTELCGGTHVHRTGDIAVCKVISESAVAAGVRRIEVVTAQGAEDYFRAQDQIVQSVAATLKSAPADVTDRVAQLVEDRKRLEKELSDVRRQMAAGGGASGGDDTRDVAGTTFVGRVVEGVPAKELKGLADDLKTKLGSGVVALVAVDGDKASLVVGVTDDLTDKFSAVDLVREGAAVVGGKGGGGRPDMAQAGGPDGSKATEALAAIEAALSE